MPLTIKGQTYYRTNEVCRIVGICRNTLFNWCKKGIINEVEHRDYRGWRLFTQAQVDVLKKKTEHVSTIDLREEAKGSSVTDLSW